MNVQQNLAVKYVKICQEHIHARATKAILKQVRLQQIVAAMVSSYSRLTQIKHCLKQNC